MKRFILFFVLLSSFIYAQAINSPALQSYNYNGATLAQALDEYYTYASDPNYDWLILNSTQISSASYLNYSVNWGSSMLMWDSSEPRWSKWTIYSVIAYARAYRAEANNTKQTLYLTKAQRGAEFILWLENTVGGNAIPDEINIGSTLPSSVKGPYATALASIAMVECYLSFGDQKYYDAAKRMADWLLVNKAYPYELPEENYKYYSNVNILARPLEALATFYKINGDQKYLDRAIMIAQEIIAWQDYQDSRDPWGESKQSDGTWDGSWYWWDYSPSPNPPATCEPNGGTRSGFSAERSLSYHCATLDGLIKLLEVVRHQNLPGLTTTATPVSYSTPLRNSISFSLFRNQLISSIKKGINFLIANQETSTPTSDAKVGLFRNYKNYKFFGGDNVLDNYEYKSCPHGLPTVSNAYTALIKANALTTTEQSNLLYLTKSVSSNLLSKFNGPYADHIWYSEGMLTNWSNYSSFSKLGTQTASLSLVNQSFEDKEIMWELWSWDQTGVEISSAQKRTGNNAVHITDNNSSAGKWASLLVTVTPNTTYKAEAYARIVSNYQALYIHYYDASYNLVDFNYTPIYANSSFEYISVQKQAPSNAVYARITMYADWYGTSEGYWDDISFGPVSPKVSEQTVNTEIPVEYSLGNYPNPFNPTTKIQYALKYANNTKLTVYDVTGKEVANLVNGYQEKGKHEIEFDAGKLSSGIYFYSIQSGEFAQTKKMLLVK